MKIPFSKIDCSGKELDYIKEVIDSGWLTYGGKSKEFEDIFSRIVDAKHAMAVNSCTAALHLALDALGIKSGDKVFVPTWTFTASAEVISYFDAVPIFLDVDYSTGLLTPEIIQKAIIDHPDTKAIIVVHYAGQSAQMFSDNNDKGILDLCNSAGIRIIEDAAHAFPTKCDNHFIGSIGDITCFSFYANKTITTGEGGMVTTQNDEIADRIKTMRLHGINKDAWNRYTSSPQSWEYDIVDAGFKYNTTDLSSAIGLAQLERYQEMRDLRQEIAEFYLDNLKDIKCLDLPKIEVPLENHSWHIFNLVLNDKAKIKREELLHYLQEKGIGFSVHYKPLHRMTYYRKTFGLSNDNFPNAERLWKGCFSLPIYPLLTIDERQYIIKSLREFLV